MTKLNYLLAYGVAASAVALSAAPPSVGPKADSIEVQAKSAAAADSLTATVADSIQAAVGAVYAMIDGDEYILKDGAAYKVSDSDVSEESPEALMTVDSADVEYGTNRMTEAVADHVVPIVGIVFGLPCAAIVCIVWFLTNYFIRRNRDKNALIS